MPELTKGLVGLSALAFVLAVLGSLADTHLLGTPPEAYSRASTNLILLAIGIAVCFKDTRAPAS